MPTTPSVAMNHPSWRSTAAVLQQATHLVSPKQLVIGDIFHPVVRVQELHHSVMPHVLAILAGVVPAVRLAHRQKAHEVKSLQPPILEGEVLCRAVRGTRVLFACVRVEQAAIDPQKCPKQPMS